MQEAYLQRSNEAATHGSGTSDQRDPRLVRRASLSVQDPKVRFGALVKKSL